MTDIRPAILLGAGGHAKVLVDLLKEGGTSILGICDPVLAARRESNWLGLSVLGGDDVLAGFQPEALVLVNGVGFLPGSLTREKLYLSLHRKGFHFASLVHVRAIVSSSAELNPGVQVMAGATVQPGSIILENTIVNTQASVDHDCTIGPHVHIAPGANICGGVTVGRGAFVGAGATVAQGINIGEGAVIGAGVTLTQDASAHCTYRVVSSNVESYKHSRELK